MKRQTYKGCIKRMTEKTGDKKKATEFCKIKFGK